MLKLAVLVAAVVPFALGCGGSTVAPDNTADHHPAEAVAHEDEHGDGHEHKHGDGHEHGGGHEHDFPPAVTAFHDVLSPNWHAAPGAARLKQTCEAVGQFRDAAKAINETPAPPKAQGKEKEWAAASGALLASVDGLERTCRGQLRTDFDATFQAVHEAFHALVAVVGHEQQK